MNSRQFCQTVGLIVFLLAGISPAIATEIQTNLDELESELAPDDGMAQLTQVSQLSDIQPSDWAFQALQSLVERYGCIVGYPNRTFRGDRALTRYEFAAGLNACLDQVQELLTASTNDFVKQQDLITLKQLTEQFAAELATLRGRIDALDSRTATLEKQEFSPTTKLSGVIAFGVSSAFARGDVQAEGVPIPNSIPAARLATRVPNPETGALEPLRDKTTQNPGVSFSYAAYITLTSSFTGQDALITTLTAGNGNSPSNVFASAGFSGTFGNPYTESNPALPLAPGNVGILELAYDFPINHAIRLVVGPKIQIGRYFDTNPYTNVVTGAGGLNNFASPLGGVGLATAGVVGFWRISDQFTLRLGYASVVDDFLSYPNGAGPSDPNRGLFNSSSRYLAQLDYAPSPTSTLRLLYIRSVNQAPPSDFPFFISNYSVGGVVDDGFGGRLRDITGDTIVFNFDWLITPQFAIYGRYSYSSNNLKPVDETIPGGKVNMQGFQLGLAFPDLFRKGALGVVNLTVPFDIRDGKRFFAAGYGNGGTEYDLEVTYSYPLSDRVLLVPSFFATFNVNNFSGNPVIFTPVVKMEFLL